MTVRCSHWSGDAPLQPSVAGTSTEKHRSQEQIMLLLQNSEENSVFVLINPLEPAAADNRPVGRLSYSA